MVFGDFNMVRYASKRLARLGSLFHQTATDVFNDFISICHLRDVPLGRHAYTRIRSNCEKLSKLDRFLVSEDVFNIIQNLEVIALDRLILDYRPIVLRQSIEDYGPVPFKLYNSGLHSPDFDDLVKTAWSELKFVKALICVLFLKIN